MAKLFHGIRFDRHWCSGIAFLACVLATPLLASAAEADIEPGIDPSAKQESSKHLVPQELFQTDTVYTQEQGEFQVTAAPRFRQINGSDYEWEVPLALEYGLTDSWQIAMEWDSYVQHHSSANGVTRGIGDLEVGTQYSWMNIGGSQFDAAAVFAVGFPTGSVNNGFSEGFIEYQPSLILARDMPEWHNAQLFAQIGMSFVQRVKSPNNPADREPAANAVCWSVGAFVPFSWWIASLELSGTNNRWNHGGTENDLYITPGATVQLAQNWQLGVGVPVGLTHTSDRFQFITQLTWEF